MALTNASKHSHFQVLQAEAISFTPGQPGQPVAFDGSEQRTGNLLVPPPAVLPQTAGYLPGYVMSCYPFIDQDPNARLHASCVPVAVGPGDVQRRLQNGQTVNLMQPKSTYVVNNESDAFSVDVFCPPPPPPPPAIPVNSIMAPQYFPATVFNPSLPVPILNALPPPNRNIPSYAQGHGPVPGPPSQGHVAVSPTVIGFNQSMHHPIQAVHYPTFMYSSSSQTTGAVLQANQAKSEDKANNSKSQAKTKVIVCKDNSSQTDFNDELAQLTLAEKPNTLFNMKDPVALDADSDSGYSSPLHRKNQTSSTAQSSLHTPSVKPPPAPSLAYLSTSTMPPAVPQSCIFQSYHNPIYPFSVQPTYQISQFPGVAYQPPLPMYGPARPSLVSKRPDTSQNRFSSSYRPRFRGNSRHEFAAAGAQHTGGNPVACTWKGKVPPALSSLSSVKDASIAQEVESSSAGPSSSGDRDLRLPFEDEDEFPILFSAAGGLVAQGDCFKSNALTYGDVLKGPAMQTTSRSRRSSTSSLDRRRNPNAILNAAVQNPSLAAGKDSKSARKKQKRQMLAYQAAEEELAEISLEQQMLKELSSKKKQLLPVAEKMLVPPKAPLPPCQPPSETAPPEPQNVEVPNEPQPPALFDVSENTELPQIRQLLVEESAAAAEERSDMAQEAAKVITSATLDSTLNQKRAKEKDFPNKKKPSSLKRVILKEREAKTRQSLLDDCSMLLADGAVGSDGGVVNGDSAQGEVGSLMESLPPQAPTSAEMSPVSQMSPINMSPLSGSPAGSTGASPIAGDGTLGSGRSSVISKIHSRRFREYCNQVLDKEIDDCCTELLQDLVRFQDCLYQDDPTKAKSKRRFVLGLREVTKHLKLGKLKCIIISPNLERIQSKGGLDDALNAIIEMSQKQDVPFVFALGRRALGRACAKLVPVSVVGVFSYDGSEEIFFRLRDLTQKAREAYADMVAGLEREMAATEPPATNTISTTAGNFEKLFPHLGHSRTPSACSAISFISSILSEPISENYPQSEPETDSRGYEIRHENRKPDLDTVGEGREEAVEQPPDVEGKSKALREDMDDGHEADTEEDGVYVRPGFGDASPATRESKERTKSVSESDAGSKPDPGAGASGAVSTGSAKKRDGAGGHLLASGSLEPVVNEKSVVNDSSVNVPVQVPLSTSERSERIESWVAESQRVTKQLREMSPEVTSRVANGDEIRKDGEEDEEEMENLEEVDDIASVKTADDSSDSEYEETTDVPFSSVNT